MCIRNNGQYADILQRERELHHERRGVRLNSSRQTAISDFLLFFGTSTFIYRFRLRQFPLHVPPLGGSESSGLHDKVLCTLGDTLRRRDARQPGAGACDEWMGNVSDEGDGGELVAGAAFFGTPVCVSLAVGTFEAADSEVRQRSKCGHDLIPVNQTDGSGGDAAGALRDGRTTGHRTHSLKGRPVRRRVSGGLQVDRGRERGVRRVPRLVTDWNVVLVRV